MTGVVRRPRVRVGHRRVARGRRPSAAGRPPPGPERRPSALAVRTPRRHARLPRGRDAGRARAASPQIPTMLKVRRSMLIRCMVEILRLICGHADVVLLFRLSLGDSGSPSLSLQALCHGTGGPPGGCHVPPRMRERLVEKAVRHPSDCVHAWRASMCRPGSGVLRRSLTTRALAARHGEPGVRAPGAWWCGRALVSMAVAVGRANMAKTSVTWMRKLSDLTLGKYSKPCSV
jgi:hypothetical protein